MTMRAAGRRGRLLLGVGALLWCASGLRQLEPEVEFGVLEGAWLPLGVHRVERSWTLAPPGLLSLSRYPRGAVELAMPGAEQLMLAGVDGSRYGFLGSVLLEIGDGDRWRSVHHAAAGRGLRGVLLDSVREAGGHLPPGAETGIVTPAFARALNHRLRDELEERGLKLRRFTLDALDFLSAEPGREYPLSPTSRLLVIGLDGADWAILDPLLDAGRLPNLARLVGSGARAKLLTISPTLSPVVWTTVATGVEPRRHGILDFLVATGDGDDRQPVTSAQRRAPTFWEILSERGLRVGVVGWWASWPADAVNGYLVSDRVAYQLFGYRSDRDDATGKTWPTELYASEVLPRLQEPAAIGWDELVPYLSGERRREEQFDAREHEVLQEFRTLLASGRTYLDVALALRAERDPRLEVVYFEGTDTVGHLFMPYRPPLRPGVDPRAQTSFAAVVDRYYETIDGYIGRLLEGRDESWTVMLLSDHGFASDENRPRLTDSRIGHGGAADWHRRFGVLVLSGAGVRPGVVLDEASVYDIAPTVLALFGQPVPRSWPGQVLGAALDPALLERQPVRYTDEEPAREPAEGEEGQPADPASADLMAKLESLGYVAASGGGSSPGDTTVTAANNTGVALLAEGRHAEAEAAFRRGLAEAPNNPMLIANLGSALRLQGRLQEAREVLERAFRFPLARRSAGQLLAQIAIEEGRLDEAQRYLEAVLAVEPDAAAARTTLGLVFERRGRPADAEAAYRRAAAVDLNAAQPRNLLGNLARERGDDTEAERWYREAIEANPYELGAYNNLALVYQDRGEMDRAVELYSEALTRAPNNPVVLNNLASLYYAQGELDEAEALWHRATRTNPSYPSPYNNLAGLEIRAGRYDDAERLLLHALELEPGYGDARLNLALVHRARGDLEGARRALLAATEDPRSRLRAWSQLAALEYETGRVEAAVELLEKALALRPDQPELRRMLEDLRGAGAQVGM